MQFRLPVGRRADHIGQLPAFDIGTRPVLRTGQRRRTGLLHGEKIERRAHQGHAAAGSTDHQLAAAGGG